MSQRTLFRVLIICLFLIIAVDTFVIAEQRQTIANLQATVRQDNDSLQEATALIGHVLQECQ